MIVLPARTWAATSAMKAAAWLAPATLRWTPSEPTHDALGALYVAQSAICSAPPYSCAFCRRMRLLSRNV